MVRGRPEPISLHSAPVSVAAADRRIAAAMTKPLPARLISKLRSIIALLFCQMVLQHGPAKQESACVPVTLPHYTTARITSIGDRCRGYVATPRFCVGSGCCWRALSLPD